MMISQRQPAKAASRSIALSRGLPPRFRTIHEAIVAAKTRRLQRELMFHADLGDASHFDGQDIGKLPQRPIILGDKWDF